VAVTLDPSHILVLIEALGIGLLIGIERERSAGDAGATATAGVRTFALAALIGALAQIAGGWQLTAVALAIVGGLRALSQFSQPDAGSGLTTSFALLIVLILGAMAATSTLTAAAAAVLVAALLAAREALRGFSRSVLTAFELRDGLILGVAALVILPILPDQPLGPSGTVNLQRLFLLVLLVMGVGALSHIATRVFGARLGLPLSGFLAGFVSSTAAVVAMARKVREVPGQALPAAAGATHSSIASLVQTAVILLLLSPALLTAAAAMLVLPALVATLFGGILTWFALRRGTEKLGVELPSRVFSVSGAVGFALIVTAVLVVSALANTWFGDRAVLVSIALAGAVSTSSAAVALASLVAAGQLTPAQAVLPLAVALTVNTLIRIGLALRGGEAGFSAIVALGLALIGFAVWLGMWAPAWVSIWLATLVAVPG